MIRHTVLATVLLALAGFSSPVVARHRHAVALAANDNLDALIASKAAANNVPAALVRRVIRRESGGNARAVHAGNYGLMQIRLATARSMGYRGSAAGLLDPKTNMTYAVKYLAGAYRAAGGNMDRAVHYYAAGYYYAAKRKGLLDRRRSSPIGTFTSAAVRRPPAARHRAVRRHSVKMREARATGESVSSASSLFTGRLDYY